LLHKLTRRRSILVEECAVGEVPGTASLCLSDETQFSTLSQEWRDRQTLTSHDYKDAHWTEGISVRVVTLDELAKRHGMPPFVKIDVEKYEDRILAGMSFRPRYLSFEFNAIIKEVAQNCLARPQLRGYRCKVIAARAWQFLLPQWNSIESMTDWLHRYSGDSVWRHFLCAACLNKHRRYRITDVLVLR